MSPLEVLVNHKQCSKEQCDRNKKHCRLYVVLLDCSTRHRNRQTACQEEYGIQCSYERVQFNGPCMENVLILSSEVSIYKE